MSAAFFHPAITLFDRFAAASKHLLIDTVTCVTLPCSNILSQGLHSGVKPLDARLRYESRESRKSEGPRNPADQPAIDIKVKGSEDGSI